MKKLTQDEMIDEVINKFDWKKMCKIVKDLKLKSVYNEEISTIEGFKKYSRKMIETNISFALLVMNNENIKFNKYSGYNSYYGFLSSCVYMTKKGNLNRIELNFNLLNSISNRDGNDDVII